MKNAKRLNHTLISLVAALTLFGGLSSLKAMEGNLEDQLFTAIKKRDTVTVKQLLSAGADVDAKNELGWTSLHTLASMAIYGYDVTELTQILLDAGANVNAASDKGYTTLHWAAKTNKLDLVTLLLKAGADPTIQISKGDSKGKTPLDMATADNIKKILRLYTTTEEEIKPIIPALAVFERKGQYWLPKDLRKEITKDLLVQNLINEKLKKAKKELPSYNENELRQAITNSVIAALRRSPKIQEQDPHTTTPEDPFGTWHRDQKI